MYLYIGQEKAIFSKDIIGVFDLDNATVSKISRDFLKKAEKSGQTTVVLGDDLPKSFIITNKNEKDEVIISQISPSTVKKRLQK